MELIGFEKLIDLRERLRQIQVVNPIGFKALGAYVKSNRSITEETNLYSVRIRLLWQEMGSMQIDMNSSDANYG